MRKLFAAAGLALVMTAAAVPLALAHSNTTAVVWKAPTPGNNDDVTGIQNLAVETDNFRIVKWKMEVLIPSSDRTYPSWGALPSCSVAQVGSSTRDRLTCDWDTAHYNDGAQSVNGEYMIRAEVWNDPGLLGSSHSHVITRLVWVENAPADLAGITRSFDSNSGQLTVSWAANPEPDISRYVVQRYDGSTPDTGSEQSVPTGTRCPGDNGRVCFSQALTEPGEYRYRVSPVRFSGEVVDGQPKELEGFKWVDTESFDLAAAPETPRTSGGGEPAAGPDAGPEPEVFVPGVDPAAPTTTPAPGGTASPGSTFRPSTGGGAFFPRPSSSNSGSRATTTTTEYDPGYNETLPYNVAKGQVSDEDQELAGGEAEPRTIERIIQIPRPREPRALLIPLAGGLALFVFAMQVTVMLRRRPNLASAEDDFGDWMGL